MEETEGTQTDGCCRIQLSNELTALGLEVLSVFPGFFVAKTPGEVAFESADAPASDPNF